MGAAFWNFGRVVIGAAILAVLAHPAPALADSANIVGYNLSVDVDYPPVDPNNPGGTPTLTNIFMIPYQSGSQVGEYFWGAATDTGTIQAIEIPPSSVTQSLPILDRTQFVYSLTLLAFPPNSLALFADYTDASNVQHLVVAMDPTVAAAIAGQSFGDTFDTSIAESDVINALQVVNGYLPNGAEGFYAGEGCAADGPCGDAETLISDFFFSLQSVEQLPSNILGGPTGGQFDGLATFARVVRPGELQRRRHRRGAARRAWFRCSAPRPARLRSPSPRPGR